MTRRGRTGSGEPPLEARAGDLHVRGVQATAAGRPATGIRLLEAGLRLLGWPAGPVPSAARGLGARLLLSLAHAEAEVGRTERGLDLLREAEELIAPADRGVLLQQRGLMLMRTGRTAEVLPLLDAAVPLLEGAGHAPVLARTLLNRAALHLGAGRVRPAREDLGRCGTIAADHGLHLVAAKAVHNVGSCALVAGDIPAALSAFDTAADGYREHAPGFLPVLAVDRARALLAAGLAGEAGRGLDEALELVRRQRLSQDHAEAELVRAHAALLAGDLPGARRWAARAERRFQRRGNEAWAALAELTRLRAGPAARRVEPRVRAATELAARLAKLGLPADAELAEWLAIRALVAGGQVVEAAERQAALRAWPGAPMTLRLTRRLVRAELAGATGRSAQFYRELRAGLATLAEHRARLGSLDLQAGTGALGLELAQAGLGAALDDGSPRLVFGWSERARAQAFRLRPVRPPADPVTAEAVAELRQLRHGLREAELAGRRDPAAQRRCGELERLVRQRRWQLPGSGEAGTVASLGAVSGALAEGGQVLVSFASRRDRLVALVIRDRSARLVRLDRYAALAEPIRRLLSDLDALAGRRLPTRLAEVIERSARSQLALLAERLVAPLAGELGDAECVLVPTRALSTLPWGMLPGLAGRPVTVAPSATAWLAARTAAAAGVGVVGAGAGGEAGGQGAPLLVAGPGLTHAEAEVAGIGRVYPGSRQLTGPAATVAATLRGLDGARIAHIAAHGHHDRENVLFSRLELVDGPLMAYDVPDLAAPPRLAVLSSCDVGRAVVRPGDEILGFTAALLYAGTPTVVAGVTRVADDVAVRVMTAFHRGLATGAGPARALADATRDEPYVSLVCFGAG
jgi:tetratricopeptide (TPR) repeat protein